MTTSRRSFVRGGVAASLAAAGTAGFAAPLDPQVLQEMQSRLKYLSPPDGTPAFGAFPSPAAQPFKDPLFIPPVAVPLMDMSAKAWLDMSDPDWVKAFNTEFEDKAKTLRLQGVDIGSPPLPDAHQHFYAHRPQKFYVIREREISYTFHSDYGIQSWCWGYEAISLSANGTVQYSMGPLAGVHGSSPGPTFHARYGEPILVRRINGLPEIGTNAGNANLRFALPSTTTHLHNGHTASESDGFPGDWINPGEYWDHHYGNFPSGHDDREKLATLWYHDHRMDFTACNVYSGLDGFYLLFDEDDADDETKGWNLPSGKYDIPLILHDLLFAKDSQGKPQLAFDAFMTDGIIGDRYTVNRVIQPTLKVERRKYRFRLLDGGPSRFYELALYNRDGKLDQPFIVLTGDGNFQPNPLLVDTVYMGVAQRVDVILDFSTSQPGEHLYLVNQLVQTNGKGPTETRITFDKANVDAFFNHNAVMRFEVVATPTDDKSAFPLHFRDLPKVDLTEVARERLWVFDYEGGLWTINGQIFDPTRVDAGIEQDSAEIWTFRNNGNGWHHPIHSHFTEFIVLEINGEPQFQGSVQADQASRRVSFQRAFSNLGPLKQQFDQLTKPQGGAPPGARPTPRPTIEAFEALPPDIQQRIREGKIDDIRFHSRESYRLMANFLAQLGLGDVRVARFMGGPRRDVALLLPNWEVKVFMRWKDFLGKHVMHCHNVVHEDHAMMIRWEIVPQGKGFDTPRRAGDVAQVGQRSRPVILHRVEGTPARASAVGANE